jgi:2,4-diketo-3-deoxy-L-fuconate hydrolase
MKLLRYGDIGAEKPGLLDDVGQIRDLSPHIADLTAQQLSDGSLASISEIDIKTLAVVEGTPRYGIPFSGTRQFVAIGLNYSDHAAESAMAIPKEPILFTKAVSCLQGPNDPVKVPRGSRKMDWEVELGIVIGKRASYVARSSAMDFVAGYVIVDDLSEREFQLERGGSWDKGKGCDTFGPVGPWLVTKDEVGDVQNLSMWLDVNGRRMQSGTTSKMIFDCATLISYVSEFMVLLPGDIITSGTPPGVGMGMKPPVFLKVGDIVSLGIEKLGAQSHTVTAAD